MNKQQGDGRIEWTDYTWNTIAGCQHGCRWVMPDGSTAICYAEAVAEGIAELSYPLGFNHHYWRPSLIDQPLRLKQPSKIFLDSMSDLMGHWVPDEQIEAVLDVCRRAHWHTFQLLTKNAPRLQRFEFPPNVWVGVSAPPSRMMGKPLTAKQQNAMVQRQLEILRSVKAPVRWMSIEPLSFDIAPLLIHHVQQYTDGLPLEWAVIGAASKGAKVYQPDPEHIRAVIEVLDAMRVPVFFKGNLKGNPAAEPWREAFPIISEITQLKLLED